VEKPAPAEHEILDLLRRRWSPHAFDARPVEADKLHRVLEAARWAMSSYNEQPWNYIIGTKDHPEDWQRLFDCLEEGNRAWAHTAPVLMLSVASLKFARNGTPNREAQHDVGAASAMMTIQATAEGLFVHQMAGFKMAQARQTFQIPDDHEPMAAIAMGYPGDINVLPENLKQRTLGPRVRKPLSQIVFRGKWGQVGVE
jgi:nitroreductase